MKNSKIIIVVVLMLVMGFGGYFISEQSHKKEYTPIQEVSQEDKIIKTERSITGETVESGINNIGELATAEYYYTHVQNESKVKSAEVFGKKFNVPLTESSFIFSFDGLIKAGIDFTGTHVNLDDDNKTLTITIPKAKILSAEIDTKSYQLFDEKNNIFNPISVTDVTTALDSMNEEEKEKAIGNGLLEKAEGNAKTLIENFMKGFSSELAGYTINITFE